VARGHGKLPVNTYPLARINEAVQDQLRGVCVKAVLIP
jgi:hypothetical protein